MRTEAAQESARPEIELVMRRALELVGALRGFADSITVIDREGRLLFASEGAARVLGFDSPEAVLTASAAEVLDRFEVYDEAGDPLPATELPGRLALEGVQAPELIVRYRIKGTGEERWANVVATPILDERGKPRLAVSIFHDITERRRADERLRFLAQASEILSASLDYEQTLASVAELAIPLLADWCIVDELQPDRQLRRVAVAAADPSKRAALEELRDRYPPNWDSPQPAAQALRAGEAVIFEEFTPDSLAATVRDDQHAELMARLDPRAAVAVPLIAHGQTVGAITLAYSETNRRYSVDDVAFVTDLAARAALAMDSARIYRAEQTARADAEAATDRLRTLQAVSEAALTHLSLDDLLPELLSMTRDILGVDSATILVADPERNAVVAQVAKGLEEEIGVTVPIGEGFAGRIAAERRALAIENLDEFDVHEPILREKGLVSALGVPLLVESKVVGVLHVGSKRRRIFDDEERTLLQLIGDRVALAFENSRLYRIEREARVQAEARRERLAFLAEASEVLASSLDYPTTLQQVARLALPTLADCCVVDVLDEDRRTRLIAVAHVDPKKEEIVRELEQNYPTDESNPKSPVGRTLRDARTLFLPHLSEEVRAIARDRAHARGLKKLGLVTGIVVPLVVGGQVLGAITFLRTEAGRRHDEADVALAEELAGRAAVAVDNARLHRATQQAFEQSDEVRALLDTLLANAPVGFAFWDRDLRYVRVNRALAELNGVPVEEHVGRRLADVASSLPQLEEQLRRVLETGEPVVDLEVSSEAEGGPGRDRTWLASYYPVRGADGIVVGVGAVVNEITQRKRDEEERLRLLRAEQAARVRLAFLAEASEVLTSSLDYERTLEQVAQLVVPQLADWCVVDMAGEDDSLHRLALAHVDPAKVQVAREAEERYPPDPNATTGPPAVMRTGQSEFVPEITDEMLAQGAVDDEHLAILRDLGLRSYMCVPLLAHGRSLGAITFIAGESGIVYGAEDLALAKDLARHAALAVDNARHYRAAEERGNAARVLSYVGDGVFLLDRRGVIRLWNPAAEAITGLPREAVIDRLAEDAIPGWTAIRDRVPVSSAPGQPAGRPETTPLDVGEQELWLSISGVAFADGTVYAFRDLTEERRLEELRSEFVATASHELRTPLAAVYGAAMTLKRHDVELGDDRRERLLDVISDESDRLARIVNDILWASRLDSGRVDVSLESVDPAVCALRSIEAHRAHLPASIRIDLLASDHLPSMLADPDKVRQVLTNLIDNAVKFSLDGGTIEVRVEPHEHSVRFSVRDEGIGMPPHEQRRIFEKFYRLDPNLTRGVGGTGLGLYICRELVKRMDGRIWVASKQGQGSTFFFELPAARQPPEAASKA